MDPLGPLAAVWLLSKSQSNKNQSIPAYAVPAYGWLVIQLPWDTYIVIGNTYAFNSNGKQHYFKRYGDDKEAGTARDQFIAMLGNSLKPMPTKEPARAFWWASPRLISAKWRQFVWALDERDNIATVETGHFLGKCLQGTQATCSDVISKILQASPGSLDALPSATVGHYPGCRRRSG